jgi:hypothetical protein
VALNLPWPALRIPVVRVIIPGLEGASMLDGWVPGARATAARDRVTSRDSDR